MPRTTPAFPKTKSRPPASAKRAAAPNATHGTIPDPVSAKNAPPKVPPPVNSTTENMFAPEGQVGGLLTKGLDLVEAGFSLGLNLLTRLGAMSQDGLLEKLSIPFASAIQQQPENPAAAAAVGQRPPQSSAGAETKQPDAVSVENRIPIFVGQTFRVSFSINNDSQSAARQVTLRSDSFHGRHTGATLDQNRCSVEPPSDTIGPMDFAKFTLTGTLPIDLPPDVYEGFVVVSSDADVRIPVRLTISMSV